MPYLMTMENTGPWTQFRQLHRCYFIYFRWFSWFWTKKHHQTRKSISWTWRYTFASLLRKCLSTP